MFMQTLHPVDSAKKARSAVLIVEDERISRRALSALLAASGYETQAVASAEEALRALKKGDVPHIALVDLDLPGMNGLELISRLSKMDPSVYPVLITAAGGEALSTLLHDRGVAYMRKPVDFGHLLALLSEQQLPH